MLSSASGTIILLTVKQQNAKNVALLRRGFGALSVCQSAATPLLTNDTGCGSSGENGMANQPTFLMSQRRQLKRGTKPPERMKWDWRQMPEEYTTRPIKFPRMGGRDYETGLRVNKRVGGGVKFDYFLIDPIYCLPTNGEEDPNACHEERVLEVRRDANRTAFIALTAVGTQKRWRMAADGIEAGRIIRTFNHIPTAAPVIPTVGDCYPLGALPATTQVCCVEQERGAGAAYAVIAGSFCTVLRRVGDRVEVQLPSKHVVSLHERCMCTVGHMSNPEWGTMHWGSMNMKRRFGIKQRSGLWHRKTGDLGRKIRPPPPVKLVGDEKRRVAPYERWTLSVKQLIGRFGTHDTTNDLVHTPPFLPGDDVERYRS